MLIGEPRPDSAAGIGVATVRRYFGDGMIDRAPTLAYYGVLSLFPTLLVAVTLVRLVGGADAPAEIAEYAQARGASSAVADALRSAAATARGAPPPATGAVGLAGFVTLIYGASRAFSAAGRALDTIARRSSTSRSLLRRAEDIGWTCALLLLFLAVVAIVAVSGKVLEDVLGLVGITGEAVGVWSVLRWPVIAALALLIVAVVRWAAPTGERPPFRLWTPGALLTVVGMLVGTAGFNVYVSELATYNATYGAFAGAVILLLWIWLGGIALLAGAELDAVLAERLEQRRAE